ncbi:MAG: HepT-like ribonuclease domain-containing protein [Pseudonocardiaceae bacterium]
MRDATEQALDFVAGRSRPDLDSDLMLALALTKLVEVIGEAAKQVSPETRARFPGVPWSDVARTRDRLVHHYFDIDLDVLWQTVTVDLPQLLTALDSTGGQS